MAQFKIQPSTNRQSKGENWETVAGNAVEALEFAEAHAPANVREATLAYGVEALREQLKKMKVGDQLTECWSMAVFEARIERIS